MALSPNLCAQLGRSRLKPACLHSFHTNSFHNGFINERETPTKGQNQNRCNKKQRRPTPACQLLELTIDIPRRF
jgi:hypothetical protein